MEEYNVLILSAGRRVELTKLFKKAAIELEIQSNIIVGDGSEEIPARYFADKFYQMPLITSGKYIDKIIEIANLENISLIVPTIDTELQILADNKELIENKTKAKVLISDSETVKICNDKILTQKYLIDNNFDMPTMLNFEEIDKNTKFPLFIKPIAGSSSIGAYKVDSYNKLKSYIKVISNPMIQEFAEGEEYTVDIFLDFNSQVITVVPRLRMATRSGEISKGKIVKDKLIISEVKKLMNVLKPIGHVTVQLIKTKDEKIKFIEINPRFGGGAPMSIQSGANSPKNLYKLLMGDKLTYNTDYKDNIRFFRFDDSVCIDENDEVIHFD